MPRETFDEGVDAAISAIENLMDKCVESQALHSDRPDVVARHSAHRVAYYEALTALEEIRRGDDGCKLRFSGTRAERLQMYLLERAERYLEEGGDLSEIPCPVEREALLCFLAWLKKQVEKGAVGRTRQLEV